MSLFTQRAKAVLLATAASLALTACETTDRLSEIGDKPKLTAIQNPVTQAGYRPVQMPMPAPQSAQREANSLWRSGSRAFFKDQRAHRIGDILTVRVTVADKATISNQTKRSRANSEEMGADNLFGLENTLKGASLSDLLKADSSSSSAGAGSVNRSEQLQTTVAAIVTQVLPNGNLVIEGRQEVRVNLEVREMIVAGVVRPEDIESANIIDSAKIAEARISYGGRGQISDVQQARYGQQVLDVLLPF
ncbi:MAG: flagellar basal body L-ring protein FlgH [Pseudomonadota bacterium]